MMNTDEDEDQDRRGPIMPVFPFPFFFSPGRVGSTVS